MLERWSSACACAVAVASAVAGCGGGGSGHATASPDGGASADATLPDGAGADAGSPLGDAAGTDGDAASDATLDASSDGSFTLTVSDASVVSTYDERVALGFKFGFVDGVLGALKNANDYSLFASAHSQADAALCPGTPDTQGAYRLGTALDSITTDFGCQALIQDAEGGAPDGGVLGAFDRDYVGGGPVMRVKNPDGGTPAVIMTYHAEFHWGPQCGTENAPCFYGTIGMAVSTDDGVHFAKLGEIIQPNISRPDWIAANPNNSLAIGAGPFVIGDANHRAIDPATATPATSYIYVFYVDQDYADAGVTCASNQCLGVARANLQAVTDAAFALDTTAAPGLFKKYYAGNFDQPAASGDPNDGVAAGPYTPVASATFEAAMLYDRTINQAIMAYRLPATKQIGFRASSDLVTWPSQPIATAIVDEPADGGLRYPSLIGETATTMVGASQPWLFYTNGALWKSSTFESRRLFITVP